MRITSIQQDIRSIAYEMYRVRWLHDTVQSRPFLSHMIRNIIENGDSDIDAVYVSVVQERLRTDAPVYCSYDTFLDTYYRDRFFIEDLFQNNDTLILAWERDMLRHDKETYYYRIWWCGNYNNCFVVTLDHPITPQEKESLCRAEARKLKEPFIAVRSCCEIKSDIDDSVSESDNTNTWRLVRPHRRRHHQSTV